VCLYIYCSKRLKGTGWGTEGETGHKHLIFLTATTELNNQQTHRFNDKIVNHQLMRNILGVCFSNMATSVDDVVGTDLNF
jgi:hypothetical protein